MALIRGLELVFIVWGEVACDGCGCCMGKRGFCYIGSGLGLRWRVFDKALQPFTLILILK